MATKLGKLIKKVTTKVKDVVKKGTTAVKNIASKASSANLGASASGAFNSGKTSTASKNLDNSNSANTVSAIKNSPSGKAETASNAQKKATEKAIGEIYTKKSSGGGGARVTADDPDVVARANEIIRTGGSGGLSLVGTTPRSNDPRLGSPVARSSSAAIVSSLGTTSAPSSLAGISGSSAAVAMPGAAVSTPSISTAQAGLAGSQEYTEGSLQDLEQKRQEALKQQTEEKKGFLDNIFKTSPQEAGEDAADEIDFSAKQYFRDRKVKEAEIETLNSEFNAAKQAMEEQIALSYDKLGSNDFINNQIAQIQRNAAPKLNYLAAEINTKQATLALMEDNFEQARSYIQEAITNATANQRYKLEAYSAYMEANQPLIDAIDDQYKNAINFGYDIAAKEYDRAVDEKEKVGDLMLDYNGRGAGIKITDSYEDAVRKASPYSVVKATGSGSNSKVEADIRGDLYDLKYNQGLSDDEIFIRLRTLYSPSEISDSSLQGIIGGGGTSSGSMFDSTPVDIGKAISSGGLTIDGVYNSLFGSN